MIFSFRTILLAVFFTNFVALGFSQQNLGDIQNFAEPGKAYAKCQIISPEVTRNQSEQYIKIKRPEWIVTLDTIYKPYPERTFTEHITKRDPAFEWVLFDKIERRCLSADPANCLSLAYVEVPGQYEAIFFNEPDSFKIVEVHRLVTNGMLSVLDSLPFTLGTSDTTTTYVYLKNDTDTYIKTSAGAWTEWREIICPSHCPSTPTIRMIQTALKEKGYYHGELDNILSSETKAALVKFQKDHSLPACTQVDFFYKVLGLEGYSE